MSVNILVVDDDPGAVQLMGRILEELGDMRFATSGVDAVRLAHEQIPDLVLLDAEMPGMSGFKVFDALKAVPELADVPVMFVTSHSEPGFEVCALEMGAADFIAKPIVPPLLKARVRTHLRIKQLTDELRRTAETDALTGVANRRRFDEILEREWAHSQRCGDPLSLLLIDVDHFKLYNDRYGHPKGDSCLQQVVVALQSVVRRTGDLVARCGGEEFAVLLPNTGRTGADRVAKQVLAALETRDILHEASLTAAHVTVSIGISCYDESGDDRAASASGGSSRVGLHRNWSSSDLLLAADRALYSAKHAGRAQARLLDMADTEPAPRLRGIDSRARGVERV